MISPPDEFTNGSEDGQNLSDPSPGAPSHPGLGARRRRLLAALVVVALLVVGAGVVTITRLLDTRVDTTFPDRVARPQAAPVFSGPSSCDKVLGVDQTLLRESTGDVRVGYSVTLPVAFSTCDTEITAGTYLVYGVTLVSPATDGSGELPPLEEAYLVVGEPFVIMLSYDANGVDLVSSVEDYDPSAPLPSPAPRPEVSWPPEVLLTSTLTENPVRLSIVWLLVLDMPLSSAGALEEVSQRVADFGYVGSNLPLACQPGAVDDVVHFEGVEPSEIYGYGVAFESREDAQTFADQYAGSRAWYDSVVEDDVFCERASSTG